VKFYYLKISMPLPQLEYWLRVIQSIVYTRPLSKLLQIEVMNSANQIKPQSKAFSEVSVFAADDLKTLDSTNDMLIQDAQAG
jgi:hypothetical protein